MGEYFSLPQVDPGSGASEGDAKLDEILERLLPGGVTPELRAAFKADAKLMVAVKQIAEAEALDQRLTAARAAADAPKPEQWIGGWPTPGGPGRRENPAYTTWKDDEAKASALLAQYYTGAAYDTPTPAYKQQQTRASQAVTAAQNQIGVVQTRVEKPPTGQPTASNPPDMKEVPTGKPGETKLVQYDPGTGQWKDVLGPDGKPVPPKQGTVPSTPNPRVDEGTQSWDLKELDGVWWQVPIRARKDGSWEPDTSRTPQRAQGMPGPEVKLEVIDGVPHTYDPATKTLKPVAGYVKPPQFRTDARGQGYTSTDNGQTWKPAAGLPGTPQTVTVNDTVYPLDENGLPITDRGVRLPPGEKSDVVEGYLVRVDPATNQVTRVDLYTPEQRARLDRTSGLTEQTAELNLERTRAELERAKILQDPVAEYQRQVQLTQQQATAYRDQLNDKVLRGETTVEDASREFDRWWDGNVEAKLTPYQSMAESAYRKEQNEYLQRQAQEQARVEALNRQREIVGYEAGETARDELNALAPQARSPEFLAQLAQNVSNIGKPLPGGPSQHHGGMQFSPESLSLANVRRAMPNLTEVGNQAVARALAKISPAAAQQVGMAPPKPPGLPDFQAFAAQAPFQIPNPALPVPGEAALDLGNPANAARLGLPVQPGYAGTRYQGGRVEPWQIPA